MDKQEAIKILCKAHDDLDDDPIFDKNHLALEMAINVLESETYLDIAVTNSDIKDECGKPPKTDVPMIPCHKVPLIMKGKSNE